eukprot:GHVU01164638.1.p2 GENE.GHVU01164638.1~~GHVU01164638.1.p2  ORF type:complete len:131 (-),score=15.12 GHVU01164638.1:359-751(-)
MVATEAAVISPDSKSCSNIAEQEQPTDHIDRHRRGGMHAAQQQHGRTGVARRYDDEGGQIVARVNSCRGPAYAMFSIFTVAVTTIIIIGYGSACFACLPFAQPPASPPSMSHLVNQPLELLLQLSVFFLR